MDSLNQGLSAFKAGASGGGAGDSADPSAMNADGTDMPNASATPQGSVYDKLQIGGSAVAALSKFGMAMNKARTLRDQANDEKMGASQEYLNAQAASNEVQRQYNAVVGAQEGAAAAGNIDIASGSVNEAKRQAQLEAARVETKTRNMAIMNASQRRARMFALKQAAGVQTFTAWANLAMDTATAAAKAMGGGAPGGGGMDPSAMAEAG